ncbi:MAG: alanine--tRNA ligase, partial [Angelakisella sp.]
MKWTGLNELREKFLSFYESKNHTRLASAPLVPQDEASLLLINSGMAPLKKYFMGLATLPDGSHRATSCQKCIRTPDIENVGKTARHGTYFEMLGNFSFGDYFKEEATTWAWEFCTKVLELPVDRLYVSVFQDDDEAYKIWTERRGVAPDHMVHLGREDNFWEIGSGPCGPCSEIYFDRGPEKGCGSPDCKVGCECDRFVEFWNLVFTQFNSDGNGNYIPLEHPNIDTGMGLERLACIMQGVDNLFEVDTLQNIMKHICSIAKVEYKKNPTTDVSIRVITDHIRSTTFMIGDGVVPQNEGRGYVLRRLLRRAARHGRLLGITEPFLYQVCETVIKENEGAYPELLQNKDYIVKVIRVEEERFAKTIDSGLAICNDIIEKLEAQNKSVFPGDEAFKLYDTYGFPIDLTREIASEHSISVDEEGFARCMKVQRETAREAT